MGWMTIVHIDTDLVPAWKISVIHNIDVVAEMLWTQEWSNLHKA